MAKTSIRDAISSRVGETAVVIDASEVDIAYSAMFGFSSEVHKNVLVEIPLSSLVAYSKHPFKPYQKDKLDALVGSVRDNGLQQPIIVRRLRQGEYEILAGHNRTAAYREIGYSKIPAIIIDVDDDQAAMVVTETNLRQREKLLPSEKAFAYKLQLDAMKHQGQISENSTSTQIAWKSESAQVMGELLGISKDEIRRHIRLTELIPQLLDLIDTGKLAFVVGVDMSYISETQQELVYQVCIIGNHAKLDIKLSDAIRRHVREGEQMDSEADLNRLIQLHQVRAQTTSKTIIFKRKNFAQYLAKAPEDDDLEVLFLEFLKSRYG